MTMANVGFDPDAWSGAVKDWQADNPPPSDRRPRVIVPGTQFKFTRAADLELKQPEFLIDDMIETDATGVLFGPPGCGKSFISVDVALSVATGSDFHGRKTKRGPVFYIAGEGHAGLARRFHAWSQARGVSISDALLFKSERAAQFLDMASARAVADACLELASQNGPPAMVVLDTLARNFGPGDENSTSDMGAFVAALDDLRANFPACTVLIVHHTGHGDATRSRGSSVLKGASDFEFGATKDGPTITLKNPKMKDAPELPDQFFKLVDVQVSPGIGSAVLETADQPEARNRTSANERLALATYENAAVKSGVWEDGAFRGVHLVAWRTEFYAKHSGDTLETKRRAFGRVRNDLTECRKMTAHNDVYLSTDSGLIMGIVMRAKPTGQTGQ
jgi:hypothetical protein